MRLALTSQEPVGRADVGAEELHRQLAKLVKGARRPVLPNSEGEAGVGEAELPGLEGAARGEGGVDDREVHAGAARPLAFALPQGRGQQEDLEVDGEQGEAAVCREKSAQGVSLTSGGAGQTGEGREPQEGEAQSSAWVVPGALLSSLTWPSPPALRLCPGPGVCLPQGPVVLLPLPRDTSQAHPSCHSGLSSNTAPRGDALSAGAKAPLSPHQPLCHWPLRGVP